MNRFLRSFNANTVMISMVSALLCYMQTRVLTAVERIPVLEQQVQNFRDELNMVRDQLKREEQERKDSDRETHERLKMVETDNARHRQP